MYILYHLFFPRGAFRSIFLNWLENSSRVMIRDKKMRHQRDFGESMRKKYYPNAYDMGFEFYCHIMANDSRSLEELKRNLSREGWDVFVGVKSFLKGGKETGELLSVFAVDTRKSGRVIPFHNPDTFRKKMINADSNVASLDGYREMKAA